MFWFRTSTSTPRRPALAFRWILVGPFLVQVMIAIGLTGYFSIRNSQKSAENFAFQLQTDVGQRIGQRLDSYLAMPHRLNHLNRQAIQSQLLHPQNLRQFESVFVEQMRQFPEAGYLNFGKPNGEFIGVERRDGQLLIIDVELTPAQTYGRSFHLTADGQRGAPFERNPLDSKVTQEGWFADAVTARKPTWTQVYQWADRPEVLSISASHPLYDADRQLIGVVGVDLILTQLSDFLQSLTISPQGRAFIVERNGLMIASSTPIPLYQAQSQGEFQRLNAIALSDPLIRRSGEALQQQFGSFAAIQSETRFRFELDGQAQLAQVIPWKDAYGLDWLIVIATPASDFTTVVTANTQSTLTIGLVTMAIVTGGGIFTARWIARPLQRLSDATETLTEAAQSSFSDDSELNIPCNSPIGEVNTLAHNFQTMAQQLRHSFQNLAVSNQRLESVNQDLAAVNDHLEARVSDRTIELSDALDRLQKAQVQMVQAEKMSSLGQMVAGVAHEINNPINFIHANLSYTAEHTTALLEVIRLYQQEYASPSEHLQDYANAVDLGFIQTDLPKIFGSMRHGTERVKAIVDGLRTFSRLDEATIKRVDLQESLDSALLLLQHRLTATKQHPAITVIKQYGDVIPIECYAGQINQVFFHILNNAIDAILAQSLIHNRAVPHRGQITLTTQTDSHHIQMTIADNGNGIDPTIGNKIFDPFFTTKPIGQGIGLSLSIAYQVIVEQHGGTLSYESNVNAGSRFTIGIPLTLNTTR
jgi:signal transduction histidine kinase/HAMP domain-containing protein